MILMWISWVRSEYLVYGCTDFHIAHAGQSASFFPCKPYYFHSLCLAANSALITFIELPLVLMASKTSPSCPMASTYLEKIWSKPKSLPAQVMCEGSDIEMAASALRRSRYNPDNSSAKCMASHMDPPLPQEMSLWPLFNDSTIIDPASSIRSKLVSSERKLSSTDFGLHEIPA